MISCPEEYFQVNSILIKKKKGSCLKSFLGLPQVFTHKPKGGKVYIKKLEKKTNKKKKLETSKLKQVRGERQYHLDYKLEFFPFTASFSHWGISS